MKRIIYRCIFFVLIGCKEIILVFYEEFFENDKWFSEVSIKICG